jgi:uncharacterized protein (TIGR02246 family)
MKRSLVSLLARASADARRSTRNETGTLRHALIVAITSLLVSSTAVYAQLGTPSDEAAIRAILDARNAAYNSHDAKALAATYAPDADLVTGTGQLLSGRAAIEKNYVDSFAGVDRNAMVKIDGSKLRFLTADAAILDLDGVTTGRSDGAIKTHATWVYAKRNGQWTVVAIRATRIQ